MKLTRAENEVYEKRLQSLIVENMVGSKNGYSWHFKGRPNLNSRLDELHQQVMVEILNKRSRYATKENTNEATTEMNSGCGKALNLKELLELLDLGIKDAEEWDEYLETLGDVRTDIRFEDREEGRLFGIASFGPQEFLMSWEGEKAEEVRRTLKTKEGTAFAKGCIDRMVPEWLASKTTEWQESKSALSPLQRTLAADIFGL